MPARETGEPSPGSRGEGETADAACDARPVRQVRGATEVERALASGCEVGLVLAQDDATDPDCARVVARAREAGVPVRIATAQVLSRMTSLGEPAQVLALVGRAPAATLEQTLARGGAFWLLTGVAYPTNAGVAVRTAEGSGAAGIAIDATWDHSGRRAALRASMRADWYMPVFWESADAVLDRAAELGVVAYAIENSGEVLPWELDLAAPAVFVIGGESAGISAPVLARCQEVIRVPMAGFIPSYNLQIALGVVATERLRQLGAR